MVHVELMQQKRMDIVCINLVKSYISLSLYISKLAFQFDPSSVDH